MSDQQPQHPKQFRVSPTPGHLGIGEWQHSVFGKGAETLVLPHGVVILLGVLATMA